MLFDPLTYEIDVPVEIYVPDNSVFSEERKEFSASVSVEAINAIGHLTSVEGGPIEMTVYDNDCEWEYLLLPIFHIVNGINDNNIIPLL